MSNEVPDTLPDSVRKQHEAAEARKAEMAARREKTAAAPQPAAAASPSAAEPTPQAAATPQAAPTVTPATPTVPAGASTAAQSAEPLEQKLRRLEQEKADLRRQLDSANGRYGGTVQSLKSRIFDLERQLESKAATAQAPASTPSPSGVTPSSDGVAPAPAIGSDGKPSHLRHVPQEMLDRFGEELPDLVAAVARGLDDERMAGIEERSNQTIREVDNVRTQIELDKFWSEAERLAPGAHAVNGDAEQHVPCAEGWGVFLDEPVRPGSPLTRRLEAEESVARRDPVAFAALVREFQSLRSKEPQHGAPLRPTVPAQAVPQSVVGDQPPAPKAGNEKRQIPQSEIADFEKRAGRGEITIEEANQRMKEYAEAYRENRVLVGA